MAKKGRKLFRKNLKSLELRQGWAGPERIRKTEHQEEDNQHISVSDHEYKKSLLF
uniref:Uncharacterized protein n=1 Tax=Meloidogyne enterolobii TaxID=390850 RepID=A0A6V7TSB2_MELEN|nr:unnamed protein product [Meloidogyne enterolobii]